MMLKGRRRGGGTSESAVGWGRGSGWGNGGRTGRAHGGRLGCPTGGVGELGEVGSTLAVE